MLFFLFFGAINYIYGVATTLFRGGHRLPGPLICTLVQIIILYIWLKKYPNKLILGIVVDKFIPDLQFNLSRCPLSGYSYSIVKYIK